MPIGSEQLGHLVLGGPAVYEHTIEEALVKLVSDGLSVPLVRRRAQGDARTLVAYELRSDEHEHELAGGAGFAAATFELRIHSQQYVELGRIADELRELLDGFDGLAWDREVMWIGHSGGGDEVERPDDGSQNVNYVRVQEYEIQYLK